MFWEDRTLDGCLPNPAVFWDFLCSQYKKNFTGRILLGILQKGILAILPTNGLMVTRVGGLGSGSAHAREGDRSQFTGLLAVPVDQSAGIPTVLCRPESFKELAKGGSRFSLQGLSL